MGWVTQKPNGKYLARWRDERGRTKSKQFPTEAEAVAHIEGKESTALAREVLAGPDPFEANARGLRKVGKKWVNPDGSRWDAGGVAIALDPEFEYAEYLRRAIARNRDLRGTTRALYERIIRNHIDGTPLARADIRYIKPGEVEDYWASLRVGNGALGNVYRLLALGFNTAVRKGDVDVSPLKRAVEVRRPSKKRQRVIEPLSITDVRKLADAAGTRSQRDRLEVLTMALGGLRAGEVGGLRVQDIEWERDEKQDCTRARLNIRQQVVRETGRTYTSELKSEAARRPVMLPCEASAELKDFIDHNEPAGDGRVFHGLNDGMRDHIRVNKSVHDAAKKAGLSVHAHQLRHTAVSLLIKAGASPKDVQVFAGHSSIMVTMDVYTSLFPGRTKELAQALERLLQDGGVT